MKFPFPIVQRLLIPLAFLALALLMTSEVFTGRLHWDERVSEYMPWRLEAARLLLAGEFPWFTPNAYGGMPLFALGYVGVLYPPNLLYFAFNPHVPSILEVFHSWLMGFGMYLYLRSWRLGRVPALTGGVLALSMSFLLFHAGHVSMREAACLAPWVLLAGHRTIRYGRPGLAAALALAVLIQLLIGYPQMVLLTIALLGFDWLAQAGATRRFARGTAFAAVGGIAGVLAAGLQLATAMAHAPETPRKFMTIDQWQTDSFPPSHLVLALSPKALSTTEHNWVGINGLGEVHSLPMPAAMLLAATALVLAGFRFHCGRHNRLVLAMALGCLVFALLAFGKYLPVNATLFGVKPFNMFRVPARWMMVLGLAMCVMAAVAVHWMMSRRSRLSAALGAVAGGAVLALFLCWLCWMIGPRPHDGSFTALLHGPVRTGFLGDNWALNPWLQWRQSLILVGLLVALVPLLLRRWPVAAAVLVIALAGCYQWGLKWSFFWSPGDLDRAILTARHPMLAEDVRPAEITRLYALSPQGREPGWLGIPQATNLFHGLPALGGYTPLLSSRLVERLTIGQQGNGWRDLEFYRNPTPLQLFAVSHVVIDEGNLSPEHHQATFDGMESGRLIFGKGIEGGFRWYGLANSPPRVHFAASWRPWDPNDPARDWIWQPDATPLVQRPVAIDRPDWKALPPPDSPLATPKIRTISETSTTMRVDMEQAAGAAVLVVRDAWWPGWQYRTNGGGWRPVRLADGVVRWALVPAGTDTVEFRYIAPQSRTGFALSGIGLLMIGALGLWARKRGRGIAPAAPLNVTAP